MTTEQIINHIESEINNNSGVYPEKKLDGFAEACLDQNTENELADCLIFYDQTESGDITDLKTWGISSEQWKASIESALAELIRDRANE
jgi:hypothetical protein